MGMYNNASSMIKDLYNIVTEVRENSAVSMGQRAGKCFLTSRGIIDEDIMNTDVIDDVISVGYQFYTALVLYTTQLSQFISDNQRMTDVANTVATESFMPYVSFEEQVAAARGEKLVFATEERGSGTSNGKEDNIYKQMATKDGRLAAGRMVPIKFRTLRNGEITMNFHVYIQPYTVSSDVVREYVGFTAKADIIKRLILWRNGEKRFFRDIILQKDIARKRQKAIINDKSGTLKELESMRSAGQLNLIDKVFSPSRANICNNILIVEKNNFEQALNDAGITMSNQTARDKFMFNTFALMVFVVNMDSNTVELYIHGLPFSAKYTFAQMKRVTKGDKYDLVDITRAFGQNMAPRF